jgi:hypothetical protein
MLDRIPPCFELLRLVKNTLADLDLDSGKAHYEVRN